MTYRQITVVTLSFAWAGGFIVHDPFLYAWLIFNTILSIILVAKIRS